MSINTRTKWDILDNVIKNLFKEYLVRIESKHGQQQLLGLTLESLNHYYVGDMLRSKDTNQNPDLLPYGYLVGDFTNIILCLNNVEENSVDKLCFETLVPKNILQRYISLLTEFKHLLLCGQTGTGKSFIAKKIGEYLIKKYLKLVFFVCDFYLICLFLKGIIKIVKAAWNILMLRINRQKI